jgi:hypothetical protein
MVVMGHFWGQTIILQWMWWIEDQEPGWWEAHIRGNINIAGTVLGSAKVTGDRRESLLLLTSCTTLRVQTLTGIRHGAALRVCIWASKMPSSIAFACHGHA